MQLAMTDPESATRLCVSGYAVPGTAIDALDRATRRRLVVRGAEKRGAPIGAAVPEVPLVRRAGDLAVLPRALGYELFGVPEKEDVRCPVPRPEIPFAGELRSGGQQEMAAAVRRAFDAPHGPWGGICSAPCGFGKTAVCLEIVRSYLPAVIVTHAGHLAEQWRGATARFLPGARVGEIRQARFDVGDDIDICIAMVQTLASTRHSGKTFLSHHFRTAAFDECHLVAASVFSRSLFEGTLGSRNRLGVSATVDRTDGLTGVFSSHLGPVLFHATREIAEGELTVTRLDNPRTDYPRRVHPVTGSLDFVSTVTDLVEDVERTSWIVSHVVAEMRREPRRRFLLLSDRRQHVTDLETALREALPEGTTIAQYVGGMAPEALTAARGAHVLLATYQYASEGMDADQLNAVLFATPAAPAKIVQCVGRVQRKRHGNLSALVVDVVDSSLRSSWYKRSQVYRQMLDNRLPAPEGFVG